MTECSFAKQSKMRNLISTVLLWILSTPNSAHPNSSANSSQYEPQEQHHYEESMELPKLGPSHAVPPIRSPLSPETKLTILMAELLIEPSLVEIEHLGNSLMGRIIFCNIGSARPTRWSRTSGLSPSLTTTSLVHVATDLTLAPQWWQLLQPIWPHSPLLGNLHVLQSQLGNLLELLWTHPLPSPPSKQPFNQLRLQWHHHHGPLSLALCLPLPPPALPRYDCM